MNKHPLVVLSGGLDSSYMLYQLLEKGDVHTCYIKSSQAPNKIPLELAARKKVIEFFEEKTGNKVLSDSIVEMAPYVNVKTTRHDDRDRVLSDTGIPDVAWGQAHLWITGLLRVSDGRIHSEVCLGNIMGDQISQCFHNMKEAWDHLQAFTKQNPIPLNFPLALRTKDMIFQEMPLEILPHLWICDLPDSLMGLPHPCGECMSCQTMRKTIFHWEFTNRKDFRPHVEEYVRRLAEIKEENKNNTKPEAELPSWAEIDRTYPDAIDLSKLSITGPTGLPNENKESIDELVRVATNSTKPHHPAQCG